MNTNDGLRDICAGIEEVLEDSRVENKKIGKYLFGSEIDQGGMGTVYLAKDTSLDRLVVIKMIKFPTKDPEHCKAMVTRFRREAMAAARVPAHPNVVGVIAFEEIDGRHLLVMERIEGRSLRDEMMGNDGRYKPLKPQRAVEIVIGVLKGLEAIHGARIVHRDIKPGNVMLSYKDDQPKILDFGLGKILEASGAPALDMTLTQVGMPLGSPLYMSPEQTVESKTVTESTDIYSAGVILYQLLTGNPPYFSTDPVQIYEMHRSAPVPAIVPTRGPIPAALEAAVRKALSKSQQDRHASASAFRAALEAIDFSPKPKLVADPVPPPSKRRGNGFLTGLAAFAALAVLGVLVYAQLRKEPQAPAPRAIDTPVKVEGPAQGSVVQDETPKQAIKASSGITIPPPPPVRATVAQGCELYRQGRTSDAITALTAAMKSQPDDPEGLYCLCGAYIRQPESRSDAQKTCKAYRGHPKREADKTTQVDIWLRRIR